jgi:hypothetical protein
VEFQRNVTKFLKGNGQFPEIKFQRSYVLGLPGNGRGNIRHSQENSSFSPAFPAKIRLGDGTGWQAQHGLRPANLSAH